MQTFSVNQGFSCFGGGWTAVDLIFRYLLLIALLYMIRACFETGSCLVLREMGWRGVSIGLATIAMRYT